MDVFFFSLQSFKMAHLKLSPTTCNTIMEPNKCYYDVTLCTTEIKTKFAAIGQNKVFERNCDAVKTWNSLLRMFALCSLGLTSRQCILKILICVIFFIIKSLQVISFLLKIHKRFQHGIWSISFENLVFCCSNVQFFNISCCKVQNYFVLLQSIFTCKNVRR